MAGVLDTISQVIELERQGKIQEAEILRAQTKVVVKGKDKYQEALFETLKGKPVFRNLIKILRGERLEGFELAKFLSSFITHQIIEAQKLGCEGMYALPIKEQSALLYKLLGGFVGEGEVNEYFVHSFSKFYKETSDGDAKK